MTLFENDLAAVLKIVGQLTPLEQFVDTLVTLFLQDADLVLKIAAKVFLLHPLDIETSLVLVLALAGKDLNVNDGSVDSRRAGKRCVLNVAGLFAEDRAEQFFRGGKLRFALRRNFSNEDRSWFDLCTDADNSRLVQIAEHVFTYVRNITCDLFRTKLRVACLNLELFD